jgi:hypothetical protein
MGAISFVGSTIPCPVSQANTSALSKQITMHSCGEFDRQLYRLIFSDGAEFKFCQVYLPYPL